MSENNKLSTESYKGVRDFYPNDMYVQNYMFQNMSISAESYGYEEYSASVLEHSELYEAKSGEEIVNEQTYSFTDRGDRRVTLRPEMTPTIARMIAAKKRELTFPLRWYSIPNLFRYERPQRGRLREHWQLNVDLFGSNSIEADIEIISVAHDILKRFGATDDMFEIRVNSRKILDHLFRHFNLSDEEAHQLSKLLDRKAKIDVNDFRNDLIKILETKDNLWEIFFAVMVNHDYSRLPDDVSEHDSFRELAHLIDRLDNRGIKTVHDYAIVRGFDYYTGIVFEVFDTNPENNRSMFGGGRYDDLLSIFGGDAVPAVGFGMGDVTLRDFLETHDLMPERESFTDLYLCVLTDSAQDFAGSLARQLREQGLNVMLDVSGKKAGDQIKIADKNNIPYVVCIGEDEMNSDTFTLKDIRSGEEIKCEHGMQSIVDTIFGKMT